MPSIRSALGWRILGAGALVFGLLLLFCGAAPSNQLKLWRLWQSYESIPHPPDSVVLYTYKEVGSLQGNGNHCDFIAGEQRHSALSPQELRSFYAKSPELHLHIPGEDELYDDSYLSAATDTWPPSSYAVYLFEWGHSDDFDIRCY